MKQSKKGISLAFVIVVVMALMIFSAMLFSAASHSLSMTGTSTEGRQAYLTAKSAIEYAKTLAYDKAKSGGKLVPFSVGHDADGNYAELAAATAPNGTDCYAECTNPGGDGINWRIFAKVKFKNSGQYRQLAYTFALNRSALVNLPASNFLLCGMRYGEQNVFINGFYPIFCSTFKNYPPGGTSVYPVVVNLPVSAQVSGNAWDYDFLKAPEAFFCGMSSTWGWQPYRVNGASILCDNVQTVIYSNLIGVAGDIDGVFYEEGNRSSLFLEPYDSTATGGIVYFAGKNDGAVCNVSVSGRKVTKIPKGYYWFDSGVDLFNLSANGTGFNNPNPSQKKLVPLAEYEKTHPAIAQSAERGKRDVGFVEANAGSMISGDSWDGFRGLNWAPQGSLFLGWPSEDTGNGWWSHEDHVKTDDKTVFLYVKEGKKWSAKNEVSTYCAKQIFMQFVGDGLFSPYGITEANNFTVPSNGTVVFRSDLISINMMKTDTNAGKNAEDRPAIAQPAFSEWLGINPANFIVKSLDGVKKVTLAFPNDVGVSYYNRHRSSGGMDYYRNASYVIPAGIYEVPSGFNFFDDKGANDFGAYWENYWKSCQVSRYPSADSGSFGGFNISGGKYADS